MSPYPTYTQLTFCGVVAPLALTPNEDRYGLFAIQPSKGHVMSSHQTQRKGTAPGSELPRNVSDLPTQDELASIADAQIRFLRRLAWLTARALRDDLASDTPLWSLELDAQDQRIPLS